MAVDRWYIERYLGECSHVIKGHALEVKDDQYASRYGATSVDIVDIDPGNSRATIVGDLCAAGTLRAATYDVIILTQTLQSGRTTERDSKPSRRAAARRLPFDNGAHPQSRRERLGPMEVDPHRHARPARAGRSAGCGT